MSTITTNYGYKVKISFVSGSTVEPIDPAAISLLMIESEYDRAHAPSAILESKIDTKMYNKMIKNRATSKILLEVQKFDKSAVSKVTKTVIKKQLSYLLSDYSYDHDAEDEGEEFAYRLATIGLFDPDAENAERKIINNLYKGTNMMTMVAKELSVPKLIIEPFENNKSFSLFYILPQEGINKFLRYMNSHCAFYSTDFRFFQDWNGYTYLLSNKGKGIDINDGTYTTVKLELIAGGFNAEFGGIISDTSQKLYTIRCSEDSYSQFQNNVTDNMVNQIYAVSYNGSKQKSDLKINPISGSKSKPKVIRVRDSNMNLAKTVGNELELTADAINMVVFDTDISVLVPYKEFIVKNKQELSSKDGKYILTSKKEVFTQDGDSFRNDAILTFKKVKS